MPAPRVVFRRHESVAEDGAQQLVDLVLVQVLRVAHEDLLAIFAGEQDPGVDVLARIAAALGTRTWELFFDGNAMIDIN